MKLLTQVTADPALQVRSCFCRRPGITATEKVESDAGYQRVWCDPALGTALEEVEAGFFLKTLAPVRFFSLRDFPEAAPPVRRRLPG